MLRDVRWLFCLLILVNLRVFADEPKPSTNDETSSHRRIGMRNWMIGPTVPARPNRGTPCVPVATRLEALMRLWPL